MQTLSRDVQSVVAFHEKFLLPCGWLPTPMTQDKIAFRVPFLNEELQEFKEGHDSGNLVAAADALFDLAYVAIGTALFIGATERQRSFYPFFHEVKWSMQEASLLLPKKPHLLSSGAYHHFHTAMASRIKLFDIAHTAAIAGELNALALALHNLRDLVNGCHCTAAMMGVPWDECFAEVQWANMAKKRAEADGSDSKRGTPWDVVKPVGWKAPDACIAKILLDWGWELKDKDIDINFATGKVALMERSA